MCKKTIETAAKSAGATNADWNDETKILVVNYQPATTGSIKIQQAIAAALKEFPASKAASLVSKKYNLPRDEIYAKILNLKGKT